MLGHMTSGLPKLQAQATKQKAAHALYSSLHELQLYPGPGFLASPEAWMV